MKSQRTLRNPAPPAPKPSAAELLEQIRLRAYELFEQRGRNEGHELDDWLQAEAEVMERAAKTSAA